MSSTSGEVSEERLSARGSRWFRQHCVINPECRLGFRLIPRRKYILSDANRRIFAIGDIHGYSAAKAAIIRLDRRRRADGSPTQGSGCSIIWPMPASVTPLRILGRGAKKSASSGGLRGCQPAETRLARAFVSSILLAICNSAEYFDLTGARAVLPKYAKIDLVLPATLKSLQRRGRQPRHPIRPSSCQCQQRFRRSRQNVSHRAPLRPNPCCGSPERDGWGR